MDQKQVFLERLRMTLTSISGLEAQLDLLAKVYTVRGYAPGGANAINAADLAAANMTPAQAIAAVNVCKQMTLLNGGIAAQADYVATINDIRTDL